MSNPLSVRRVKVQTIDDEGKPEGEPTFGVMAADGYAQTYNDIYPTLEELNEAIDNAKSILEVADGDGDKFPTADHEKIGFLNFYGKDWESE